MTRRLIAIALAVAIAAWGCSHAWARPLGNDSHCRESKVIYDSQVTAASYSTGDQGNRLKWLPYRPAKSTDTNSSAQKSVDRPTETKRVETKRAVIRWADIEWSEAKSGAVPNDGVCQVDFHKPPKPSLDISDDPLKNPFGDARRSQDATHKNPFGDARRSRGAKAKLARVGGPNLGVPFLQPVGNAKDAIPLSGLLPNDDKDALSAPRMLLNQPSGEDGLADDDQSQRKIPTIAEELAQNPKAFMDKCPDRDSFKSIHELNDNVTPKKGKFPSECSLAHEDYQPRTWTPTTFAWTASGTCHKPLYFEQVQVERYGHSWGPIIQPVLSAAHFFVTVPILPYKMGVYPPGECMYSLGYYRPGSCAPYMLDPLPISVRGGLIQAGAIVAAVAIIP